MPYQRLSIIGAGSWGLALATAAQRAGRDVTVWAHRAETAETLARTRESPRLPGAKIDARIAITASLDEAVRCDALLLAIPAQALREVATALTALITNGMPVIACAKGIERDTRKFMTEVIAEAAPNATPAVLSGPSFAADVVRGLPTAVTLAAGDEKTATTLARALGSAMFRPYHSTDLRGVEIGGAAKNVLAIAAGIVSGRGLGASAAAALTTRGFAEILRFGRALGAKPETLTGLSGLGDTILSCSTPQSRNFSVGLALGKGSSPLQAFSGGALAEGVYTASALSEMAREAGVEMPIADAVADVVEGKASVEEVIGRLLARPVRAEV
ncbi:NAD(P)H-dependent glycerol-3-phosphate dehydrogenase [Pseudorhodoplanes sp.]|uniref:NAD(P)H-dependent glycerol-3-phosphate dehydrogenase n=1 Tax=Pseudorhodoplanes sp. TaxID=1934341 RepID=UPI002C83817E|nr:NAD(P)H-dependent glycerol-3-phosphate dehydrogenase [Pseudorhodoplanes sp.]HWV42956.1 NAD(P)H-dependent glycerol-3-phosphate dehydrogenase [Pseudorhodoplanes sp.]